MRFSQRNVILTIRAYENSVEMPEVQRLTCLDHKGGIHLKAGDGLADTEPYLRRAWQCADYLRFGDEVDAVTCGDFPRTNALKICATPPLYIEAGFRQVPMLYTQRHLLDAIRPKSDYDSHCHGLTVAQAKRLPELLSDPVMLCDSPTRDDVLLALLCEADGDGLPLIAAIKPNGHGVYNLRETDTNFILAVYGRTDFPLYFERQITPERVVYYNEERGRELNALAKLHLLRSHVVEPDLCNMIIRRPQCLVKSETAGRYGYSLRSACRDARRSSDALGKNDAIGRIQDRGER